MRTTDLSKTEKSMGLKPHFFLLATLILAIQAFSAIGFADEPDATLVSIIHQIEAGWEAGDGTPFRRNYLDFEGARYIESGGQNEGLDDLVDNHVESERDALSKLELTFSNIETHFEGNFAWAIADVEVEALVRRDSRKIHNRGHGTFLFRKVGDQWRVVHTHSSSRPVNKN